MALKVAGTAKLCVWREMLVDKLLTRINLMRREIIVSSNLCL